MKSTRVDENGDVRCPKCGAKNSFSVKRTGRAKVLGGLAVGVGALAAPKRLQCQGCGSYLKPEKRRPLPKRATPRPGRPLSAAEGAKKCRHGVRRDICALCGYTKKMPRAR